MKSASKKKRTKKSKGLAAGKKVVVPAREDSPLLSDSVDSAVPDDLVTQTEAGRAVGCDKRSISRAANAGRIQRYANGKVSLSEVRRWYYKGANPDTPDDPDAEPKERLNLFDEQARHTKIKADMAELELNAKRGALVEIDLVAAEWAKLIAVTTQRLRNIPSKLGPRVGRENTKLIKEALDEALNELAEYNPVTGKSGAPRVPKRDPKRRANVPSAAGSDRDAVGKPKKKAVQRVKR